MAKRETPPFDVWLTRKMAESGLTRKEIAEAVGVDTSAVGRWLRGDRLPERAQVVGLSLLFKVSPMAILWLTDRKALLEMAETTQDQSRAEMLAAVPELADFIDLLWKMSPKRRAALMLLAQEGDEEPAANGSG
jgi:transcriptional regulator with XRE-family HTH domain